MTPEQLTKFGATLDYAVEEEPAWLVNDMRGIHPAAHFMMEADWRVRTKDLAQDGYDAKLQPPAPYTTRMWGGGEVRERQKACV